MKLIVFIGLSVFVATTTTSCKKFIEANPPETSVMENSAYSTDATATAVITSLYAKIISTNYVGYKLANLSSLIAGLSADELTLWDGITGTTELAYYQNNLSATGNTGTQIWEELYPYLYTCNAAIEGLQQSKSLTSSVKSQLLGEAFFMRAFFYFYLTNLYGDVPLITSTNYEVNRLLPRHPQDDIYKQIITDLEEAQENMLGGYIDGTLQKPSSERVRPIKYAALALLARVYLYAGNWQKASLAADSVINMTSLYTLTLPENTFQKNNQEAIWQLQPVNAGWNTELARLFVMTPDGPNSNNFTFLSQGLVNAFDSGDARMSQWIGRVTANGNAYYFPNKYKALNFDVTTPPTPATEYLTVLRLAEQYLIRAEARTRLGDISGAISDLNIIRSRANLPNTTASAADELLTAIAKERRLELFTEWGDRWLNMKRTKTVDSIMQIETSIKGGTWNSFQQLFPIPLHEIQKNPKIIQNRGY